MVRASWFEIPVLDPVGTAPEASAFR